MWLKRTIPSLLVLSCPGLAQTPLDSIELLCANSPQVIEIWHGFSKGAPKEALENLTLEYNRLRQGETCVRPVSHTNYHDLSSKIFAASSEGNLPALAQGFAHDISNYLEANLLADLRALGIDTSELYDNFVEAVTWNDVVYGVPFNKSVHVLFYNRDLLLNHTDALAELAIPENEEGIPIPITIEQFISANQLLSEQVGNPTYWFRPQDLATYANWLWTLGGRFFNGDKFVLDSDIGVATLEILLEWTYDLNIAKMITDGSFINENFTKATFGFAIDSSAAYPFYLHSADFEIGLAPMPGLTNDIGTSLFRGGNLLIFNTNSTKVQTAAAEYINFLTSPRVNALFAAATGFVPLGERAANHNDYVSYLSENPEAHSIIAQLPKARSEPNLAFWEAIRFDIEYAIIKAMLQEIGPLEALEVAQKSADSFFANDVR